VFGITLLATIGEELSEQKYPYTTVPGKLRSLLAKAPDMGRPSKVTVAWLKSAGWTSSNDPSIIPVLKYVGILASDGSPTDLWDTVRVQSTENKARLADAIRQAYAELFAMYSDAHRKDAEALRNFFRANTTAGEQAQTKMVQTFQAVSEFADFDASHADASHADIRPRSPGAPGARGRSPSALQHAPASSGLTLNVNLQLQLPATADADVYEKLFSAMRKHLINLAEE
jgi:hypothetical protein